MPIVCKTCGSDVSPTWWKCCPKHTTEQGIDVVCQACANVCLNGAEVVVLVKKEENKEQFVQSIADYVETHFQYSEMSKRGAVVSALEVLVNDIGAAQRFINVIGLKINLYDEDLYKE